MDPSRGKRGRDGKPQEGYVSRFIRGAFQVLGKAEPGPSETKGEEEEGGELTQGEKSEDLNLTRNAQRSVVVLGPNFLCVPTLRDPMAAVVMAFLDNPGPLRMCCRFTVECYDHSVYLESDLCCPFIQVTATASTAMSNRLQVIVQPNAFPASWGHLGAAFDPRGVVTEKQIIPPSPSSHQATSKTKKSGWSWPTFGFGGATEKKPIAVASKEEEKGEGISRHLVLRRTGGVLRHWCLDLLCSPPSRLTSLTLSHLPHLTSISTQESKNQRKLGDWLRGPNPQSRERPAQLLLETVTLEHLPEVTIVDDCSYPGLRGILAHCPALTSFTMRDLPKLQEIGQDFLSDTPKLQEMVLLELPRLETIEENFLSGTGLVKLNLSDLPKLTTILDYGVSYCYELQEITLENLPSLSSIGDCFLEIAALSFKSDWIGRWEGLKEVTFRNLPKLRGLGAGSIQECFELEKITLEKLPSLQRLDEGFLGRAVSLIEIHISDLPELGEIQDECLSGCSSLGSATLSNLPKLEQIGTNFLRHSQVLTEFTLDSLPELTVVGDGLLLGCPKLNCVALRNLPKLATVYCDMIRQKTK